MPERGVLTAILHDTIQINRPFGNNRSVSVPESGAARMKFFPDLMKYDGEFVADEQINAPHGLGFPWVKHREEHVVDFIAAKITPALGLIPTEKMAVGFMSVESLEDAYLLAST
jgi:hypothetical protein